MHDVFDILVLNAHPKIQNTKQNTNNFQHVTTPPLMPKRLQLGVGGGGKGGGGAERVTRAYTVEVQTASVFYAQSLILLLFEP